MEQTDTRIRFASAISVHPHAQRAVDELIHEAGPRLGGAVHLAMLFASHDHAESFDRIQRRLAEALNPQVLLGMTSEAVIGLRREAQRQPGMSLLVANLPHVTLRPFHYEQIDWPLLLQSPASLTETINADAADVRGVVLMADPYSTPLSKLVPMFNEAFPGTPMVGGMAGGAREPRGNRLIWNGQVLREGAVGVALAGKLDVRCTVSQGCRPIGRPLVITRSRRHVIQQLGGRNALEVIRDIVGNLSEEDRELAQSRGLLIGRVISEYKDRFGRGDFLIRNIVGLDPDQGFFAVNDPLVRVGQTVQFHLHDGRTAAEDFRLLLQGQTLHGSDGGALLFSCNGRGLNLFDQPHTDPQLIHEALGDMPLAGCFAAGEIGPVGSTNFIHGHTASLMVLRPMTAAPDEVE